MAPEVKCLEGPFIYMTSGQMATADNRSIYEFYLCSHQELKCIKMVKSGTTEGSKTKWPLYLIGLRGILVNATVREWAALSHLN